MRVRAEHAATQHRVGVGVGVGLELARITLGGLLGRRWVHESHLLAAAEVSGIERRVERRAAAETGAAAIGAAALGAAHRCCSRRWRRRRERGRVAVELLEPAVDLET